MIRAKFPISQKKFKSLPEDIAHSLRWSLYGVQNGFYEYKRLEYKQLIEEGKSFYVPIPVLNDHLGTVNIDLVSLPNDLVDYIHKGKAKVIIYQDSEGFLYKDSDIEWLNTFASKHNIKKDSLIVESANQNFKNVCKKCVDYRRSAAKERGTFLLPHMTSPVCISRFFLSSTTSRQSSLVSSSLKFSLSMSMDCRVMRLTSMSLWSKCRP